MADQEEDRRHALRKSQLVEYDNVAAGHDGVLASQSGDLIVKPCKDSEVSFYQNHWKWDPESTHFAYYMPKFYGTLNLQEHPPSSDSLPSAAVAAAAAAVSPTLASNSSPTGLSERRLSHVSSLSAPSTPLSTASKGTHGRSPSRTSIISHLPVDGALAPTKPPKSWQPTHGAKIDADTAVVLENVAAGLRKPNILDVKLGARLWADDAHPAKRQKLDMVAKETTSGSLGFRIAGMKLWAGENAFVKSKDSIEPSDVTAAGDTPSGASLSQSANKDCMSIPLPTFREDNYASYDRDYGRSLTEDTVRLGFKEYFFRPQVGISAVYAREVVSRFVEDLQNLIKIMSTMESRMYSASLLFVYEGDGEALKADFRRENRMLREARLATLGQATNAEHHQSNARPENRPSEHSQLDNDVNIGNIAEMITVVDNDQHGGTSRANSNQARSGHGSSALVLPNIATDNGNLNIPSHLSMLQDSATVINTGAIATASDQSNHVTEGIFQSTDTVATRGAGYEEQDEDDEDDDEDDPETQLPKIQALKVIDFAHASDVPDQGPDENFLLGVRNVVRILEGLLDDLSRSQEEN